MGLHPEDTFIRKDRGKGKRIFAFLWGLPELSYIFSTRLVYDMGVYFLVNFQGKGMRRVILSYFSMPSSI